MGRAERRLQERLSRKAEQQEKERIAKTARAKTMARLERNGITTDDLKKNYDIGFEEGYQLAMHNTITIAFAAVCLVLHELYGFGQHRLFRVLNEMYNKITLTIDSKEAVDEVFEKTGLTIDFREPFYPVQEVEKK